MPDNISDFLSQEREAGTWDSHGDFSLDRDRAKDLLARRQSEEPALFALRAVQTLVSAGASSIDIVTGYCEIEITGWGLETFDASAETLWDNRVELALGQDGWPTRHLAASLLAMTAIPQAKLELVLSQQEQRWIFSAGQAPLALAPLRGQKTKPELPFWRLAVTIPGRSPGKIGRVLALRLQAAPIAIRLDGVEVHRPMFSSYWLKMASFMPDLAEAQGLHPCTVPGFQPTRQPFPQDCWQKIGTAPVLLRKELPLQTDRSEGVATAAYGLTMLLDTLTGADIAFVDSVRDLPRFPFHKQKFAPGQLPVCGGVIEISRALMGRSVLQLVRHGVCLDTLMLDFSVPSVMLTHGSEGLQTDASGLRVVENKALADLLERLDGVLKGCLPSLRAGLESMPAGEAPPPSWSGWAALGGAFVGGIAGGFFMAPLTAYLTYSFIRDAAPKLEPETARQERIQQFGAHYLKTLAQIEERWAGPSDHPAG